MQSLNEKRENEALTEALVTDEHGVNAQLAEEWRSQTVVLALVRHFG